MQGSTRQAIREFASNFGQQQGLGGYLEDEATKALAGGTKPGDLKAKLAADARRRLQAFPNVRLVEISGYDLQPIADASVDVVYCTVVFMHLDEWDRYNYVLEARRVLRPDGRVFIDNFSLCSDEGWGVFEAHRKTLQPHERPPHISKSSTPQELETYLRRAGFASVQGQSERQIVRYWGVKPSGV